MSDDQMIRFECSVCGASMVTDGANAERVVECPQCSASLSVPYRYLDAFGEPVVQVAEEAPIEFRAPVTDSDAELDMTPMVDVTFLLLIFFMVTAAFTMQKSFQLPAPNEDAPSTQVQEDLEDAVVVVRIDEFNTFHVSTSFWDEEQEAPSEQELLRQLREATLGDKSGNIPNTLVVEAHGDATHGKVIVAMDAGTEVGMSAVKLRTIEDF